MKEHHKNAERDQREDPVGRMPGEDPARLAPVGDEERHGHGGNHDQGRLLGEHREAVHRDDPGQRDPPGDEPGNEIDRREHEHGFNQV